MACALAQRMPHAFNLLLQVWLWRRVALYVRSPEEQRPDADGYREPPNYVNEVQHNMPTVVLVNPRPLSTPAMEVRPEPSLFLRRLLSVAKFRYITGSSTSIITPGIDSWAVLCMCTEPGV